MKTLELGKQPKVFWLKWLPVLLLLMISMLWSLVQPSSRWIENMYSLGLYPTLASLLVPITNSVPFSISGILLVLLPIVWLVWTVRQFRRKKCLRQHFLRWLRRTVLVILGLYLWFTLAWGIHYQRESIETQLGLTAATFSENDLRRLVTTLSNIVEDNANVERDIAQAQTSLRTSLLETVATITGVTPTLPAWVKVLPAGTLIRAGNASGIISPFTLEPHIDGALTEVYGLAVGTHELAHIAGYAGEADADFIAALAGLNASDPYARYAVALKLWSDAVWQLSEVERREAVDALPQRAKDDLEAMYESFRRYGLPQWVQNLQSGMYNRYLMSQGVEAGIKDYSRTTTLLLAAQQQGLF
ncbi:MAG: DUF3810 family protein [Trueperaceae bacterium]